MNDLRATGKITVDQRLQIWGKLISWYPCSEFAAEDVHAYIDAFECLYPAQRIFSRWLLAWDSASEAVRPKIKLEMHL